MSPLQLWYFSHTYCNHCAHHGNFWGNSYGSIIGPYLFLGNSYGPMVLKVLLKFPLHWHWSMDGSSQYWCTNANSPSLSQNSPSLPKKLSEFSLPKQYSRNSIPPISYIGHFLTKSSYTNLHDTHLPFVWNTPSMCTFYFSLMGRGQGSLEQLQKNDVWSNPGLPDKCLSDSTSSCLVIRGARTCAIAI